ncbi:MAG: zinc ribbon domain-containing protein [Firmicutes bacterium]|nr:zinc ribbon domain-containing protein [Bacillota bacterium]
MQCVECHYHAEDLATFCPHCGSRIRGFQFPGTPKHWRVLFPLITALSTVLPWVWVGLGNQRQPWTLYRVSGITWGWLCLTVGVAILSGYGIRNPLGWWVRRGWRFLGVATFAVGISVFVAIHMAQIVSNILHAPSPVHLADGFWVFFAVSAVWAILAFFQ